MMSFLDSQLENKVEEYFPTKAAFKKYLTVLEKYWQGDAKGTLDLIASEIEKGEGLEIDAVYYRLWIEQLADLKEKASLVHLEKHFLKFSDSGLLSQNTFIALRGLIHLELDEIKSCEHVCSLLEKDLDNPYALEFCQRYKARFSEDGSETLSLLMTKKPILDYCQWQTLSRSLLVKGKFNLLGIFLKYTEASFRKSPLQREFKLYKNLDLGDFEEAKAEAHSLAKDYPEKTEYQFTKAYLMSCLGLHKESNALLLSLVKKYKQSDDADIYSLLGHNSYLSSYGDIYSSQWENAIKYFFKAEEFLTRKGYPAKEVLLNLSLIKRREEEMAEENSSERESYKYWLINLKANDFSSLSSLPEEEIFYQYHKMGALPREGDLVFFVSNANNSGTSRLGAVYQVLSSPMWDNLDGYQTCLELVTRFENSLALSDGFSFGKKDLLIDSLEVFRRSPEKGHYLLSDKGLNGLSKEIMDHIEEKKVKDFFGALKVKKA